MIETSHIAFHIWDEPNPGLLQFDLYTCGSLDLDKTLNILRQYFDIVEIDYILFDREHGFVVEQNGREADGVHHIQYPQGLQLTKEQLDPNIGGFIPRTNKDEQDAIWSSQISFEE